MLFYKLLNSWRLGKTIKDAAKILGVDYGYLLKKSEETWRRPIDPKSLRQLAIKNGIHRETVASTIKARCW